MKTQTKKAETSKTAKKKAAPKTAKSETTLKEILNPTAEDRIRKMKNLQLLAEKYGFLKIKMEELEHFFMSSDGTKEKITVSNGRNFEFTVSNTQVIEEVLKVLEDRLTQFIEATEKQILEYSI